MIRGHRLREWVDYIDCAPDAVRIGRLRRVLKNDVAQFSERGAQLARHDEGAGRRPPRPARATEEATTPDGMPRPKTVAVRTAPVYKCAESPT
jgi:hypothetical protein